MYVLETMHVFKLKSKMIARVQTLREKKRKIERGSLIIFREAKKKLETHASLRKLNDLHWNDYDSSTIENLYVDKKKDSKNGIDPENKQFMSVTYLYCLIF